MKDGRWSQDNETKVEGKKPYIKGRSKGWFEGRKEGGRKEGTYPKV
jgi:hypothetical protein